MANEKEYKCTRCGQHANREMLTVKRAVFLEMGEGARTLKSRTSDWLCPPCVAADADWNRTKHFQSPGQQIQGELSHA